MVETLAPQENVIITAATDIVAAPMPDPPSLRSSTPPDPAYHCGPSTGSTAAEVPHAGYAAPPSSSHVEEEAARRRRRGRGEEAGGADPARGDNEEAEERRCQIPLSRGCPSWSRSSHVHRREEGRQGKPFRRTLPYGGWSSLLATIYDLPTTRSDFLVTRFSLPTAWSCSFPIAGSSLPTSPCCSPHTGSPCTTLGGATPLGGLGAGTWLERYGGGGAPLPRTQLWAMRRWREREEACWLERRENGAEWVRRV